MKCIFLYSNEEHNIFCFQQDVPLPEENPPEVRMDISDVLILTVLHVLEKKKNAFQKLLPK